MVEATIYIGVEAILSKSHVTEKLTNSWQKPSSENGKIGGDIVKTAYPVLLTQTKENVLVEVPDLEILTEGKNYEDAISMARDAIESYCISREEHGEKISPASNPSVIDTSSGTFASSGTTLLSLVDVNTEEYRRKLDTRSVRRNVSIPAWLNYEAETSGINVSRVLQEALIKALNIPDRKTEKSR